MYKDYPHKLIWSCFLFLLILFNLGLTSSTYGQNNDIHSSPSIQKDELIKHHLDSLIVLNAKLAFDFCEKELLKTSFFEKPVLYTYLLHRSTISLYHFGEATKGDSLKNIIYSIELDNIHPIIRGEILIYKTLTALFYNETIKAHKYGKEAYLIFKNNDLPNFYGQITVLLGDVHYEIDKKEVAYAYYLEAHNIFKDAKLKKEYAISLIKTIRLLNDLNNYETILEYLAISEDIANELNDQVLLGAVYYEKGDYYFWRKNYANCLKFYKKAEAVFIEKKMYLSLSKIYTRRAFISIQFGDFEEAIENNKIADKFREKFHSIVLRVSSQLNIASTFIALKKYDSALFYIEKAKTLNHSSAKKPEFLRIMDLEIRILIDRNQYEMAYATLERKIQIQDDVHKAFSDRRFDEVKSDYQMAQFEQYKDLKQAEVERYKTELERDQLIFRLVLVILILVLISSITLYFFNKIKNKRTLIQTSQKIIFIQLNSHFIFNSLTAIQSLIFQKKIESAILHLNVFSNLINKVISGTQREYISLNNEITFIKDFLKLQELRFGDILKYEFNIDKALNVQQVMVPAMLIFPFIEYAIEERVQLSKGKGEFIINIKDDHNHIVYELIDKGLGFADLKSCFIQRYAGQKILCKQLINERLSAYNTILTRKINFTEKSITLEGVNYKTLNFRIKK